MLRGVLSAVAYHEAIPKRLSDIFHINIGTKLSHASTQTVYEFGILKKPGRCGRSVVEQMHFPCKIDGAVLERAVVLRG
jgi:hypothetical protein